MHILATIPPKAISSLNWEIGIFRRLFPQTKQFLSYLTSCRNFDVLSSFSKALSVKLQSNSRCRHTTELKAGTGDIKLPWRTCRCKILFIQHYKGIRLLPLPRQGWPEASKRGVHQQHLPSEWKSKGIILHCSLWHPQVGCQLKSEFNLAGWSASPTTHTQYQTWASRGIFCHFTQVN